MPLKFSINHDDGYFVVEYIGRITDDEALNSWEEFLQGDDWAPGLNELTELSRSDLSKVTANGIRNLATYIERVYKKHNVISVKVAIYAPNPLPFGIARIYSVFAENSPQNIRIFDDIHKAESWLLEPSLHNI
jgi:hypothetical protein